MADKPAEFSDTEIDPRIADARERIAEVEHHVKLAGDRQVDVSRPRRGLGRQRLLRTREFVVRNRSVNYLRRVNREGEESRRAAADLGLNPRTLRHWRGQEEDTGGDLVRGRGRPRKQADVSSRNEIIEYLWLVGPDATLESLRFWFREVAREELRDLLRRFRRVHAKKYPEYRHVLTWKNEAPIWAMDHAEPPDLIDGVYPAIFSVRHLGEGRQLAWWPVRNMTSGSVVGDLETLFLEHGAPLVLKCDNGSAFRSREVQALCARHGVVLLYSPAWTPQYNGSCEAGVGAMKTRTRHLASSQGRPGQWTCEDLEGALRLEALKNPQQVSSQKSTDKNPSMAQRAAFKEAVDQHFEKIRSQYGVDPEAENQTRVAAQLRRAALCRALIECDHLSIRRRRVTPLLKP